MPGKFTLQSMAAKPGVNSQTNGFTIANGEAIENATRGRGADSLTGSTLCNVLSGGAGSDDIKGGRGNDVLNGGNGRDTMNGGEGNDRMAGGAGSDTLTGARGNDTFIFNARTEGGDTITDFSSAAYGNDDSFAFLGSAFGGLAAGALSVNRFQSSDSAEALTAQVRFLFETDTGILRFDADGKGAGASSIIATLQAGAIVALNDFAII
jgi:Ca2+-binding RTX toxin-like protein